MLDLPFSHVGQSSRSWVIVKDEFSTDQNLRFLKVQYLKNELRNKSEFLHVCNKLIELSIAWLHMPKILPNDKLSIYSEDRYGPVFCILYQHNLSVFFVFDEKNLA